MEAENSLVVTSHSVQEIKNQIRLVHELMKEVMIEGEHYGIIPGTKKKSLYKQGAEKLSMMFRLSPKYEVEKTNLGNGHREVDFSCNIIHIPSQTIVAQGVGSCSTMESKFRYRNVSGFEVLDEEIPKDARDNKAAYRKKGFGMKQIDGAWKWVKYGSGERQENPDIADCYNTVLKMAKKRSHIDGILTATAASDIFTQDYEPEDDTPPAVQYDTEAQAIQKINACQNLIELEKLSVQYKTDHGEDKNRTGWSTENWKNIASAATRKKEEIEKIVSDAMGKPAETKPVEEEPVTQTEDETEDMPAWAK
ncbi:hypothetical protein KAR91_06755 [Candidatus Pacearchaeota archaeon]|nr:hypothetical protein [Candidatus Pacearchaeota archaeon]